MAGAEYEFHPLANEYPLMTDGQLDDLLVKDMRASGFDRRKPITLFEGKILDGRNRYKAAKLAGVVPAFAELPEGEDPVAFIIRENEGRNHYEAWLKKRRADRVARVVEARKEGQSIPAIAEQENVSVAQVQRDIASGLPGGGKPEDDIKKTTGKDGKKYPPTNKNKGTKRSKKAESQAILDNVKAQHKAMVGDKPKPEPKATDHFGIPIQPHAVSVFAATVLFDEILAKLKECRKLYATLAEQPGGIRLLQASTSINAKDKWENRGIENAILSIEDARPYMTVCPYEYNAEHPHEEDCTLCKGLRWTVPFAKGRVPADLIKAAKEAFGV